MSVFKKQELVAAYPAYNVYKRAPKSTGFVEITVEDTLILKVNGDHKGTYSPGSVVSSAIEYNECPLAAVERAKSNGHKLVWINANGAMLTADRRAAEDVLEVEYGMLVRFQGVVAHIEKAANNNLQLVPYVEVV